MLDTGKFSRMARVSKRTLRYYDSIDLFKPERVDPDTGIRYYSAKQFADLNRILALKELGMSLDQIRRMLADDVSQEEIHGMLMLKKAEAEQALLTELYRFRSIEARLQSADIYLTQGVVLKSVPEQPFLSYRTVITDPQQGWELTHSIMGRIPRLVGRSKVSNFAAVMHSDSFDDEHMDAEMGFYQPKNTGTTVELSEDVILTERVLPAVEAMATVVMVGGPSRYPAGFTAVGEWIDENGYEVVGPQREIFLEVPPDGKEDNMVIEIQFPVEPVISDPRQLLSTLD